MPRFRAMLAALASVALAAAPAAAREVWKSEQGDFVLELGAFYKTLGTGIRMPRGLVEGTEALAEAIAEARASLPPEQAALLPDVKAVPLYGGTSAHSARVWTRALLGDHVTLAAGWQLGAVVASDRALVDGITLGGGVPVAAAGGASRRLIDFDPVLAETDGFSLRHDLDQLSLQLSTSLADITLGRQVLSWGSGRLWNPTDLLSPFAPTDIDREVRRGIDAVRVSIPLAPTAQLDLLWLAQPELRDQGAVARARFNVGGFDIAPSVAKYVRDLVAGLDATGDLGPLGVHGEIAWTRALDRNADGGRDDFVRAVAGVDWRPTDRLVLTGEYYFNGWGARRASDYLRVLQSPRVTRGEVFGAGRQYLGLVANWMATDLLTLQAVTIANLQDPSALVVPALEYWAEQSVLLRVGGYLPLGRRPDAAALRVLSAQDVTQQTDAWLQGIGSLGLESEYGASPFGLFLQLAVYFQ